MANEVYKDDANLQALWLLEETSGTRADESANGNDLTDNNTVTSSSDAKEGANSADFEAGNTEYLSITDGSQSGLDITADLTISLWFKAESLTGNHALVSKNDSSANEKAYILWIWFSDPEWRIVLTLSNDGSSDNAIVGNDTGLSDATWYHVVVVYNETDIRIYLNGSLDMTPSAYSGGIYSSAAEFRLARHTSSFWQYDGLMDEVAIFDRALSAAEVASIYNNGIQDRPGAAAGGIMTPNRGYWGAI